MYSQMSLIVNLMHKKPIKANTDTLRITADPPMAADAKTETWPSFTLQRNLSNPEIPYHPKPALTYYLPTLWVDNFKRTSKVVLLPLLMRRRQGPPIFNRQQTAPYRKESIRIAQIKITRLSTTTLSWLHGTKIIAAFGLNAMSISAPLHNNRLPLLLPRL